MESNGCIEELENRIAELPVGYISKKTIHGNTCYYRQWKENGKVKSKYIPSNEVDYVIRLIDERKRLQAELKLETFRSNSDVSSSHRLYEYAKHFYLERPVGIGQQSFEELITEKLFYVDKTSFIAEWWESHDDVSLITRPRRFGKTLNMSMINCFFSNRYANRQDLFDTLYIWQNPYYRALQGTYPVIFLTFGAVKSNTADGLLSQLAFQIRSVLRSFYNLKEENLLTEQEANQYNSYLQNESPQEALFAIPFLCQVLFRIYDKKVIILLDEYDTPMLEAWTSGIWGSCSNYIRNLFNALFKTNQYLHKALLTGITRISKESFFSDMNNFKVYSMTSSKYSSSFGFTEEEVFAAMDAQKISNKHEVKSWYNGFSIGNRTDIYNPWSITNFLRDKEIQLYWVNSSSNKMINDFFKRGNTELKYILEDVLNGKHIFTAMNEETPFNQIYEDNSALWSLLFASGYLKIVNTYGDSWDRKYELTVTNQEVYYMLVQFVKEWFANSTNGYNDFVKAMLIDDVDYMNEYMTRIVRNVFSYFDVSGNEPERFYHGFVLGLIMDLKDRFIITSNRESGLGRYDVMFEPRDSSQDHAIILEFKVHRPRKEADIVTTAQNALSQIEEKDYCAKLISRGVSKDNIYKYGIAFKGKEVWIEGGR